MVPRQVIKQAIRVRMMGGMMVSYVVVALQQKTRKIAGRLGCGARKSGRGDLSTVGCGA
jgi:hypothetical protein